MAKHSLEHQLSSLNLSIHSYDLLYHSLGQAHALVHVALSEHFQSCKNSIVHDYLCLLEEIILKAKDTFENEFKGQGDSIKDS